jgi:K+ transporter
MSVAKKRKNPVLALILSGLLPGLGQLYNNQIPKGLFFFALNIVISYLSYGPFVLFLNSLDSFLDSPPNTSQLLKLLIYSTAATVILIAAMIDAKMSADRINSLTDVK